MGWEGLPDKWKVVAGKGRRCPPPEFLRGRGLTKTFLFCPHLTDQSSSFNLSLVIDERALGLGQHSTTQNVFAVPFLYPRKLSSPSWRRRFESPDESVSAVGGARPFPLRKR